MKLYLNVLLTSFAFFCIVAFLFNFISIHFHFRSRRKTADAMRLPLQQFHFMYCFTFTLYCTVIVARINGLSMSFVIIIVLPPVAFQSNGALTMPGTADGDVVSRCQVLSRVGSVHHGADQ